jgi:hypothetical protein
MVVVVAATIVGCCWSLLRWPPLADEEEGAGVVAV